MFRIYFDGSVFYERSSISENDPCETTLSFAHVCDLHLAPDPLKVRNEKHRNSIEWWEKVFRYPAQVLPNLLDEIARMNVDFVVFGGDILDGFHVETAASIRRLCEERDLSYYFQFGNHDCEDLPTRFGSDEYNAEVRSLVQSKLNTIWGMKNPYYSFCKKGIRFIVLDTSHYTNYGTGYGAFLGDPQTKWLLHELSIGDPTVIFQHVPFNLPTVEYRFRAVWRGILACVAEDQNGKNIRRAIESSNNVLGVFAAHAHLRSEDPIGNTCQFLCGPAHDGEWRYVKIGTTEPPKSLRL